MNVTRNGKLARLPRSIREALNRRLDDGEPGSKLVAWLNALPEVQALVAAEFNGAPINEQNLSRWKKGGYGDWLAREETRAVAEHLAAEANAGSEDGQPALTETLAQWVTARYAVETRRITESDDAEALRLLHGMCADVVQLRRRDQIAERLNLDRERVGASNGMRKPGRPSGITAGLEALLECGRRNPQAQAALEQLVALARRSSRAHGPDNSPSNDTESR